MDAKRTGALIAQRRKELGLSQAELAGQLHVTDKAVSRWETGRACLLWTCWSLWRQPWAFLSATF